MNRSRVLLGAAAVAVVAALAVWIWGRSTQPDGAAARRQLAAVDAPATDWVQGGLGLEAVDPDDPDSIDLGGDGVWSAPASDGGDDPVYLVTWDLQVRVGEEQRRCEEAAAWLVATGEHLPGSAVQRPDDLPTPSETAVVRSCIRVLHAAGGGDSVADGFASWPNTKSGGYQLGPYLEARISGTRMHLVASLMARVNG